MKAMGFIKIATVASKKKNAGGSVGSRYTSNDIVLVK